MDPCTDRGPTAVVTDWFQPSGQPHQWQSSGRQKFSSSATLDAFLSKACEIPITVRVVHTINASKIPRLNLRLDNQHAEVITNPPFGIRAAHKSFTNAANLGCVVWDNQSHEYHGIDHKVRETGCSLDYLTKCSTGRCALEKHAFSLVSSPDWTVSGVCRACPRRISIAIRQGRIPQKNAESGWTVNLNDPLVTLLVSENTPHDGTGLSFYDMSSVNYQEFQGAQHAALKISCDYLNAISRYLSQQWFDITELSVVHTRGLENRIFDYPDDESPAVDLWRVSRVWLTLDRLSRAHAQAIRQFAGSANHAFVDLQAELTLEPRPISFDKTLLVLENCSVKINDDLAYANTLLDMLYKSVAVRDTRLSLELNSSLWRLSWIAFIFLPLTFLSGFFGMNVDTFADNPPVKWYFIAAAAIAVLLLFIWIGFKVVERNRLSGHRKGHKTLV